MSRVYRVVYSRFGQMSSIVVPAETERQAADIATNRLYHCPDPCIITDIVQETSVQGAF